MLNKLNQKAFTQRIRFQNDLNMLYLNVPKASSTTIKRVLFCAAGGENEYNNAFQFDVARPGSFVPFRERSIIDYNSPDLFVFTFLRNPYARVFSAYFDKIHGGKGRAKRKIDFVVKQFGESGYVSFDEFLDWITSVPDEERDPHFRSMVGQTLWRDVEFDMVGAVEDLHSYKALEQQIKKRMNPEFSGDLAELFKNMNSMRSNNALKDHIRSVERVCNVYKEDFEVFGYSKNIEDIDLPPSSLKYPE